MPRFAGIGTSCFRMCASNGTAVCDLGGGLLSSWGTLASTHTWKNPTSLDIITRKFSDLPRSGGRKGFGAEYL